MKNFEQLGSVLTHFSQAYAFEDKTQLLFKAYLILTSRGMYWFRMFKTELVSPSLVVCLFTLSHTKYILLFNLSHLCVELGDAFILFDCPQIFNRGDSFSPISAAVGLLKHQPVGGEED